MDVMCYKTLLETVCQILAIRLLTVTPNSATHPHFGQKVTTDFPASVFLPSRAL